VAHGPLGKVVELEVSSEESEAGTLGYEGGELNPTETMKMRRTARRWMTEHEEFVGRVRVQLGAKSEEEAVRTVEAYLESLAERLGGFGPYELSKKLPWLEAYPAEGAGEANQFPRREFRRRMGERAGVSEAEPCGGRGWWVRCSRGWLVGTPWTTSVGSCPRSFGS
jgi:hypothetical protein